MADYLKHYQMELKAIGPVHIGSGKKLLKKEYIYRWRRGIVLIPDETALIDGLRKYHVEDKFIDYILRGSNYKDLGGWLDDQGRLHLQGRKNDVLILSDGTMISCPEYEHDIAEMSGETDIALIDRGGKLVLVAGSGADTDSLRDAIEEYNKTMMISQQVYDIEVFGRPLPRTITGKLRRYELEMRYRQ